MLEKLMTHTGLTVHELIPDPRIQEIRRLREQKRRREDLLNPFRIKQGPGRPKKTWTVLQGKKKRTAAHASKRTARR
jgi:hypothetical protein